MTTNNQFKIAEAGAATAIPRHQLERPDLRGRTPESWACIDCGINTAPGHLNREQMEQALAIDWNDQGVEQSYGQLTEIYHVKPKVWKAAGMEPWGVGC